MITLTVGAARKPREGREAIGHAEFVQGLLNDKRFEEMMVDTADSIVSEWAKAQNPQVREAAWHKLQGINNILRQMQADVDQGIRAAKEFERAQQSDQPV